MGRKRKGQLSGSAGVFFRRIMPKKKVTAEETAKTEELKEDKLWKKTPEWRPLI